VLGTLELDQRKGEVRGLPQLYLRLVRTAPCAVLLKSASSAVDLPLIVDGLRELSRQALAEEPNGPVGPEFTVAEEPGSTTATGRPDGSLTLILVPVGTPESSLRRVAELDVDAETSAVVLVRSATTLNGRLDLQRWARVGSKGSATTSQ
jgi:hypothetical protein